MSPPFLLFLFVVVLEACFLSRFRGTYAPILGVSQIINLMRKFRKLWIGTIYI